MTEGAPASSVVGHFEVRQRLLVMLVTMVEIRAVRVVMLDRIMMVGVRV